LFRIKRFRNLDKNTVIVKDVNSVNSIISDNINRKITSTESRPYQINNSTQTATHLWTGTGKDGKKAIRSTSPSSVSSVNTVKSTTSRILKSSTDEVTTDILLNKLLNNVSEEKKNQQFLIIPNRTKKMNQNIHYKI
jgi:hypothetical protein